MRVMIESAFGLLFLFATGCNVMGIGGYLAGAGMKSPPEYKLLNRPTLVLVENFENPDLYAAPSERISRGISDSLTENKIASFIDLTKINDLKTSDASDYHKMDIPAIGRAVGAKQIIYVNLVKFTADAPIGGDRLRGQAEAQVRVIDSESGRTLWPLDSSGGRV